MKEPNVERGAGAAGVEVEAHELERVDGLLAGLPPVEPRAAVVQQTLARVEAMARMGQVGVGAPHKRKVRARWFGGLVMASGSLAAALLVVVGGRRASMEAPMSQAPEQVAEKSPTRSSSVASGDEELHGNVVDMPKQRPDAPSAHDRVTVATNQKGDGKVLGEGRYRHGWDRGEDRDESGLFAAQLEQGLETLNGRGRAGASELGGLVEGGRDGQRLQNEGDGVEEVDGVDGVEVTLAWKNQVGRGSGVLGGEVHGQVASAFEQGKLRGYLDPSASSLDDDRRQVAMDSTLARGPAAGPSGAARGGKDANLAADGAFATTTPAPEVVEEAKESEEEVEVEKAERAVPAFIEARGYFANTYLPGDAELSWLRAQVANGVTGLMRGGRAVDVEALAEPVKQPFDAPREGALGLSLASDLASLGGEAEGPRRVTLQLGLKGAEQAPTRRSALNLALVVDVASVADDGERRALWALAEAVFGQGQAEDRLTLVIHTGKEPRVVRVGPGEVTRVLAEAYEARGGGRSLSEAVEAAYAAVRAGAQKDAAMGSELVVLATAGEEGGALRERAHAEAVKGVHLSTFGVGARVDVGALRALALAGQGRASQVVGAAEAPAAVGAELSAAGRVVARAVRLRVRLGEGVQLVSVLGSRRLDAGDAAKVREAERKIDLEVAEQTGIRADRGDDEEGIQVVIPAFMAGDDHVILFDVVVSRPGLVMDVRARFKDLVKLGNGEVSASLTLEAGRAKPRAEQLNVTRNLAARKTSDALMLAARRLRAGDPVGAGRVLAAGRVELAKVAARAGLAKDAVLAADLRTLEVFEAALGEAAAAGTAGSGIESALLLAARLELGVR